MTADRRVVFGAGCTWWDSIDRAATKPSGLPCCPWCGSVLFENSEAEWRTGVQAAQDGGRIGYVRFIDWIRGRDCREFATFADAERAYHDDQEKHDSVPPSR